MNEKIIENGIEYVRDGDYYIPNLKAPEGKFNIGKYGRLHSIFIKGNRPNGLGWRNEQYKSFRRRNCITRICMFYGGAKMSFLDELYYGNINPNENRNRKKLPYEKALKTFSDIESKLTKELNGENLKLFNELINASDEISATSGVENFKIGFRLGVLMMCDSLFSDNSIILKD